MENERYPRTLHFEDDLLRKLNDLAHAEKAVLEPWLIEKIKHVLLPMLEELKDVVRPIEILNRSDPWPDLVLRRGQDLDNYCVEDNDFYGSVPISGHSARLFPVLLVVRTLLSMAMKDPASPWIGVHRFKEEIIRRASEIKNHLIQYTDYVGADRGIWEAKLLDGLPFVPCELDFPDRRSPGRSSSLSRMERQAKNQERFFRYFGSSRPGAKYPGILYMLGLVNVRNAGGTGVGVRHRNPQIALTKLGLDLAQAGVNPLLDLSFLPNQHIKTSLSPEEQDVFLHALQKLTPEKERMHSLAMIIGNGPTPRQHVLKVVDDIPYIGNGQYTINAELNGLVGRMDDLGLLVRVTSLVSGRQVMYELTEKGRQWRDENYHR